MAINQLAKMHGPYHPLRNEDIYAVRDVIRQRMQAERQAASGFQHIEATPPEPVTIISAATHPSGLETDSTNVHPRTSFWL